MTQEAKADLFHMVAYSLAVTVLIASKVVAMG